MNIAEVAQRPAVIEIFIWMPTSHSRPDVIGQLALDEGTDRIIGRIVEDVLVIIIEYGIGFDANIRGRTNRNLGGAGQFLSVTIEIIEIGRGRNVSVVIVAEGKHDL